ncbi:MAG: 2-hydroxychromene-2-carboxylate isomerase [Candidatus Puniceispirillales bacterium]
MTSPHLDYYLTPVSPWTYLGAARFRHLVEKHDATVAVRVVDYGTIFPKTGGLPLPKRAPARVAYRLADLKRFRDYLGIPLVPEPDHFPSTTKLTAHTIVAAARDLGGRMALKVAESLLTGLWAENRNMDDRDEVIGVLDRAGIDGTALVRIAETEAEMLMAQIAADTQTALEEGVFGAPSYVLNGEVFWGQDRLDLLAWRLDQHQA